MAGEVFVVQVAGDNVLVDARDEKRCGFGGYLSVYGLVEGVKFVERECQKEVCGYEFPN